MKLRSYLSAAFGTTLNVILYALTLGRFLWLEGRVRGGIFHNWDHNYRYRPRRFVRPKTEEEIVELVRNASELRLYGAAHSFNDGVVADNTLISLDDFSGVVWVDREKKQMAVKGGTRVRDVIRFLLDEGLAFVAQPSHDAQSIGGILSTDVHGTGRTWGFVSETVVSLRVIDAEGNVRDCVPGEDLFRAAIGGVGAAGIISQVTVQAVERYNIEQKVAMSTQDYVRANLDQLIETNDHVSFYLYPFTRKCQINTWNRTSKPQSFLGPLREYLSISGDALLAAWFGGFMAYTGLLPKWSNIAYGFKRGTDLVLESSEGYTRTIYHMHQELEFTVPYEQTWAACDEFIDLYESMYDSNLPYAIFEIRFTPDGRFNSFIGAGRQRRSTWLDLVINDSDGFEKYYEAAQIHMKQTPYDARPHLGKFCTLFHKEDMERLHGANFDTFRQVCAQQDPARKFANVFTRRLFWD
ncbi:MAG: D-arabinono-1,4-lactone oxidase [Pyrinomonadaceae bacterium]